ncbi:hypothetical protein GGF40_003522 [Coemansia sp. RSA 1286]|nr:hypothetical protein GGF40_003522 [Coemansia sp. RSA 1286]
MAFLTVMLWFVLSLFFGANYKRSHYAYRLDIDIVNLDNGPVGQAIVDAIMDIPPSKTLPTWRLNTDIATTDQAREYARKYAWGVVLINSGLSNSLSSALSTGAEYNSSAAITLMAGEGRHPMARLFVIQSAMPQTVGSVATQYAIKQLSEYRAQISSESQSTANVQALLNPIGWTTERVGFYSFEISPILLPLGMMAMFVCVLVPTMMLKFGSYPAYKTTKHRHIYFFLIAIILVLCLIYSLFGALAFLAYKGPEYYNLQQGLPVTGGRFFSLWMCYALTLIPMALWIKALTILIPPAFAAIASILTLIPNTLSGMVSIDLCPSFFIWFHGLPFYQGGALARYVISGNYPKIGQCLGILFGETVFSLFLLYASTLVQQHLVHTGVVDHLGNYRGTDAYQGSQFNKKSVSDKSAEKQSERLLEKGTDQSQETNFVSDAVLIVDDHTLVSQAAMRNETVIV